ncbi:MAG TPA: glycosyltransferase [Acidimicrobiales bacterium]|nr:glycosyltransferase [Acidimicrobiales bacterium]
MLEAVRGGTSRHVADVVRHAGGSIHHVALPTAPGAGAAGAVGGGTGAAVGGALYDEAAVERMRTDGAVIHHVDMRRDPLHLANGRAVLSLRALIGRVRPDVVHGHSSVGGALARVAGRAARVPVAYTANGVATETAYRLAERGLGRWTWRWVAVSGSEAALASRLGLVAAERLITIPNGIDLAAPPPGPDLRQLLGVPAGTRLVGTVARLVPQKAPLDFVRVAAAVPEAHFVLIGMGPLQPDVDAEVDRLGLRPRWHQIEHVEDAATVLAHLDVFILASAFEGAPYTPLEAMRAGVPVVLSDVVGNRDVIVDGHSGLLAPAGDIERLSAEVRRLLDDPGLAKALTDAARHRLAERFDVVAMGRALAALYASAGGRPGGPR